MKTLCVAWYWKSLLCRNILSFPRVVQELGEDAPAKPSCRSSAEVPLLKAGSGTVLKHTRYTH